MKKNEKNLKEFLLKKLIYIILITIILVVSGIGYSLTNTNYVATKKFLVNNLEDSNMISTYIEILNGSEILSKAIEKSNSNLSLQELENSIEISSVENTNMIQIKLYGDNIENTQKICDEILNIFNEKINKIYGDTEIYSIDDSVKFSRKVDILCVGILFGIGGIVLSTLFFVVCFLCNNKIKSCKDIEDITEIKSLISIPEVKEICKKKLSLKNIRAHKSEVFKTLMTNIQFVSSDNLQSKSIVITSPNSYEGKTYVATNLAIEYAKAGQKVILIDADMRKGRLAKIFNLPNELGLSNYLSNLDSNGNNITEMITRFINDTEIKNLNVITSGNIPPNPAELLKEKKVRELIKDLKVFYDVIIFDTVSILEAPESEILSKMCDLSLMLSSYGSTKINDFKLAYSKLEKIDGNSIGMGLNKIPNRKFKKKVNIFKFNVKQKITKIEDNINKFFRVIFRFLKRIAKLKIIFEKLSVFVLFIISSVRNIFVKFINIILKKTKDFKEHIKSYNSKNEEIKLISSGEKLELNNVIKEVFEDRMTELQEDIQYTEIIDDSKLYFEDKEIEAKDEIKSEPQIVVNIKNANKVKSKLDLMLEQQKKSENIVETIIEKEEENEVSNKSQEIIEQEEKIEFEPNEMERIHEELKEKQRIEREKKKAQKVIEENEFQDIDFQNAEVITEEMIRRQVEIDELERMAEQEEEDEKLKIKQKKLQAKLDKKIKRKEKINTFIENNKEKVNIFVNNMQELYVDKNEERLQKKLQKEMKKNEEKQIALRRKEARKAYRERARQMHREEARLNEELQEDNLYPRPRM